MEMILLQRKIISIFHYALKTTGSLLLGASETIGTFAELFQSVDSKAKIYPKKPTPARPLVRFGQFPALPPQAVRPPTPEEVPPNVHDVRNAADRVLLSN